MVISSLDFGLNAVEKFRFLPTVLFKASKLLYNFCPTLPISALKRPFSSFSSSSTSFGPRFLNNTPLFPKVPLKISFFFASSSFFLRSFSSSSLSTIPLYSNSFLRPLESVPLGSTPGSLTFVSSNVLFVLTSSLCSGTFGPLVLAASRFFFFCFSKSSGTLFRNSSLFSFASARSFSKSVMVFPFLSLFFFSSTTDIFPLSSDINWSSVDSSPLLIASFSFVFHSSYMGFLPSIVSSVPVVSVSIFFLSSITSSSTLNFSDSYPSSSSSSGSAGFSISYIRSSASAFNSCALLFSNGALRSTHSMTCSNCSTPMSLSLL